MIGAIEALDVLMGFEQHHSTRVVVYLPTELKPSRKTLKPKRDLESLPDDSENVYCETKLEKYLQRPPQLDRLTYPEFFRWWDLASSAQQQKANDAAAEGVHTVWLVRVLMTLQLLWMHQDVCSLQRIHNLSFLMVVLTGLRIDIIL